MTGKVFIAKIWKFHLDAVRKSRRCPFSTALKKIRSTRPRKIDNPNAKIEFHKLSFTPPGESLYIKSNFCQSIYAIYTGWAFYLETTRYHENYALDQKKLWIQVVRLQGTDFMIPILIPYLQSEWVELRLFFQSQMIFLLYCRKKYFSEKKNRKYKWITLNYIRLAWTRFHYDDISKIEEFKWYTVIPVISLYVHLKSCFV